MHTRECNFVSQEEIVNWLADLFEQMGYEVARFDINQVLISDAIAELPES